MPIKARVGSVHEGKDGPFAIAVSDDLLGTVTFSLKRPVWNESISLGEKTCVMLDGVYMAPKGWRATSARLYTPADEHDEKSRTSELQT